MRSTPFNRRTVAGLVMLPLLSISAFGCATVSPEDLDSRLESFRAEMRQDMESRDQETAQELNGRMNQTEQRLEALEDDLNALEQEFNATVERMETAVRFNLPVYFGFDEAEIRSQDRQVLDRFAQVVQEYYPNSLITVEGFTDPAGSEAYNQWLGEQRANTVMTYLVEQGLMSADRLRAVSYGESRARQVDEGGTGPGSDGMENRRVVLVVDHDGQGPAR